MWLPAAERRGEIHFWIAKSLPYNRRLALAFALMTTGLAMQVALLGGPRWIVGLPVTMAGVALLLVKGYENTVRLAGPAGAWRSARRVEVERILEISRKQKKWDGDAVDITNVRGCLGFAAAAGLMLVAAVFAAQVTTLFDGARAGMGTAGAWRLAAILGANFVVMLAPFWFTGVRSILKNDQLVNKAALLLAVEEEFARVRHDGEEFELQLQTAPAGDQSGQMPVDLKATIRFRDGPPAFLGLQMQISINSVQGKDYPYFYCVLVAKDEFGAIRVGPPPKGLVVEPGEEAGVRVVVCRQQTTRNSGYHTDKGQARRILGFALQETRLALATA